MSIAITAHPVDPRLTASAAASAAQPASATSAPSAAPDPSLPSTAQIPQVGELQEAVDSFNSFVPLAAHNITFAIDDDSGQVVVKVMDGDTNTVIRQIPSEEALQLSRSLDKLEGLLLKSSA
ncbi:hypothetical protein GCM10023144_44380 [Pigmentiphaga soli]|uniref:Flagellar protein FlaG n=1 Tax=Pigmentiphaga soli TaxID=1007095 RepID=A0ABP8HPR6_9BURK